MNRPLLLLLSASLLAACSNTTVPAASPVAVSPTVPGAPAAPSTSKSLGLVEVTFTVDNTGKMSATSRPVGLSSLSFTGADTLRLASPSISQATFTTGSRVGGTGLRYLSATFDVNNIGLTPLSNVSLVAVATPNTTAGTAVKNLTRFDGSAVSNPAALARLVRPTQSVYFDGTKPQTIEETADFQVYDPADLSAFVVPSDETLLPYGFVAHNGNSRTLAPGSAVGRVTVSVKVPLQPLATDDAFSFSLLYEAVSDSVTRVSEAPEEQGAEDHAAVLARAARFGASEVTVLPGSSYNLSTAHPVCKVPLNAADAVDPASDAFLVNDAVTAVTLDPSRKLLTRNANTRIPATVTYASGSSVTLPLDMTTTGSALSSAGGFVKGLSSGSGTVKASACGLSSADLTVTVIGRPTIGVGSGYSVVVAPDGSLKTWGIDSSGIVTGVPAGTFEGVYAGSFHALAVSTTGSVVGWGYNDYGQTTIPVGLGSVQALSAGYIHSLALKADGTVSGWGDNTDGQAAPPALLSGVTALVGDSNVSYAVKTDGTVVGWGSPYTYSPTSSDAVPAGLNNVVAISNGVFHHTALKADGTLVGWGSAASGMGTVPALTNVVAVTETDTAGFALKADGTVVGWGDDTVPGGLLEVPAGLSNVVAISAAHLGSHVLALKGDGSLVTWGNNTATGEPLDIPAGTTAQLP